MLVAAAVLMGICLSTTILAQARNDAKPVDSTAAIVFGVGSPNISAERSGTSIGVLAGGTLYLFDAGAGVERRIMEAAPPLLARHTHSAIFISHLHIDHTLRLV